MARYSVPAADRAGTADCAEMVKRRRPGDRVEILVVHSHGTREQFELPSVAAEIVGDFLAKLAVASDVAVLTDDTEVSPEDAAAILGISRPLVRWRMDVGLLPFRRVGAHRRLRLSDVLELKHREGPVRTALDDLQADSGALMAQMDRSKATPYPDGGAQRVRSVPSGRNARSPRFGRPSANSND